jgi:hypothetical protein
MVEPKLLSSKAEPIFRLARNKFSGWVLKPVRARITSGIFEDEGRERGGGDAHFHFVDLQRPLSSSSFLLLLVLESRVLARTEEILSFSIVSAVRIDELHLSQSN